MSMRSSTASSQELFEASARDLLGGAWWWTRLAMRGSLWRRKIEMALMRSRG